MPGFGFGFGFRNPPTGQGLARVNNGSLYDLWFARDFYAVSDSLTTFTGAGGSFSRASAADWLAADGVTLSPQAASNVLRRDGRGALVEASATAQPTGAYLAGAVTGAPGSLPTGWSTNSAGLTRQRADVSGTKIRFRYSGVATGLFFDLTFGLASPGTAAQGQVWAGQILARLVASTGAASPGAFGLAVSEHDAAGGFLVNSTSAGTTLTGTAQRISHVRTFTHASANRARLSSVLPLVIGLSYDFEVELEAPCLNQGQLTSPILTGTSAVTRAADNLSFAVSGIAAGADWTVAGVARMPVGAGFTGTEALFNFGASTTERYRLRMPNINTVAFETVAGGALTGAAETANPSSGSRFAWAAKRSGSQIKVSINGGAVASATPSLMPSGAPTTLWVGAAANGFGQWNDRIERTLLFSGAADDATLQSYSTLATWGG